MVKTFICPKCHKKCRSDNAPRHRKRCDKKNDVTPIENSESVSALLLKCGIDRDLLGWDVSKLDTLPNMRCIQPAPHRHHTPWQYFKTSDLSGLPPLESLLVDVSHCGRLGKFNNTTAQVWDGETPIEFSPEEWRNWPKRVLEGNTLSTRVFNVPACNVIMQSEIKAYSDFARGVMARIYQPTSARDITIQPPDFLITPRLTRSEVHHDSAPTVILTVGPSLKPAAPLKLWLLWPSTELHHLASSYGNTEAAIQRMDHGCFFVQMPGDAIAVPGNSPHAVFALENCYLYGHIFQMTSRAYDPPALQVELRITAASEALKAYTSCFQQLELGLASPDFCHAHIERFIESWAVAAPALLAISQETLFRRLVEIWGKYIRQHQSCAWCTAIGWECNRHLDVNAEQHAQAHLEGKVPSVDREVGRIRKAPKRKR